VRAVLGGSRATRPECGRGRFVEPTIFADVHQPHAHRAGGRVRPRAGSDSVRGRGIAIGNDVVYGLPAGVWTQSIRGTLKMAEKLQAGAVWIDTYRASAACAVRRLRAIGLGRASVQER